MKTEYLKELHDLQKEKTWDADTLRLAIETIFQRDFYETEWEGKSKNRDQWVSECLLQDDLEDKESRLDYLINKHERNGKNAKGEEEKTKNNTN